MNWNTERTQTSPNISTCKTQWKPFAEEQEHGPNTEWDVESTNAWPYSVAELTIKYRKYMSQKHVIFFHKTRCLSYFLHSLSEILEGEDVNTNNQWGQATVLGRMRRLLSVQEPRDLNIRPSFKRHSSDISSFSRFGPDHHFLPRVEENMQTHSKLNLNPHFYPLSTVNEVNSTSPSPTASKHTTFHSSIPSVVVSDSHQEDDSDGDNVVQKGREGSAPEESSLESVQVQKHGDKHHGEEVKASEGITDTESKRFGRFSPAGKRKKKQISFQLSRQSSTSSTKSSTKRFPSPKDVLRRKDHIVNQQLETLQVDSTHPQQTSGTVDLSNQEKGQKRNQEG